MAAATHRGTRFAHRARARAVARWRTAALLVVPLTGYLVLAAEDGSGVLPQTFDELNDITHPPPKPAPEPEAAPEAPNAPPASPVDPQFHPLPPPSEPPDAPPMEEIYVVATRPPPPPPEPVWLDVEINATHPGTDLFLHNSSGYLAVRADDLKLWRLKLPATEPRLADGEQFYRIDDLPGLVYRIDEDTQSLVIEAPAQLFLETTLDGERPRGALPAPAPPGGFLNYDLIVTRSDAQGRTANALSGLLELGVFNRFGTGTTEFIRTLPTLSPPTEVRLDSVWTQDQPLTMTSLRLGDSISGSGSWSGAVHFGGIQWSRDFTTQPGFVTTPLFGMHGEAILPSNLQLYVNNALRLSTPVPPGPFTINDLPVISGAGNAQVVVTDVLGRQQQINLPYYVTPSLLRPGLSSFSYEVGVVRQDYGLDSDEYAHALAVATHRYGFTSDFTGEVHAEVLRDQQSFGLDGVWLPHQFAVLTAALATSHSARGDGGLLQLGINRQWRGLSFGLSAQLTTRDFTDVGITPTDFAPSRVVQASVTATLPHHGSLSLNYTDDDIREKSPVRLIAAQSSWQVASAGFLNLTLSKPVRSDGGSNQGMSIGVSFLYSLGRRDSVEASASHQAGGTAGQIQVQRSLPEGPGLGYNIAAGGGTGNVTADNVDATVTYQTNVGTYDVHEIRSGDDSSTAAEAQGGIALLGGDYFFSRRIEQSFAVVRVGNYPGVHVFADNQDVAVTGSNGSALVPRIRAYEDNPLRIQQEDLPLDAEIDMLERDAIPYRRSGVIVDFNVKKSLGALITLVQSDGSVVPAGAVSQIEGSTDEYPVGNRGETFVMGLTTTTVLRVSWPGHACETPVVFRPSADPLPHLGPLTCTAVAP